MEATQREYNSAYDLTPVFEAPSRLGSYFIDGCRDGTLLKYKLMCFEPTSLAVLMAKADKYATADSAMRIKVTASDKAVPTPATPKPAGDSQGG
ncbi:Endoglucanase 3 [Hordeum vulgare]|nr:Endoglucanase 3 [Hordeum vulgare]